MPDWRAHDLSHKFQIPSRHQPGLNLALRRYGAGPPVLFVHGATFSGRIFDIPHAGLNWLQDVAQSGFCAYALDIRGYGLSQPCAFPPARPYATGAEAIEDIADAVDWISARHGGVPVSLVGWSWGTLTTARYVAQHMQGLVNALVLYAPIFAERNQGWIDMLADPADPQRLRQLAPFRLVTMADTSERWDSQIPAGADWRCESVLTALVEASIADDGASVFAPSPAFRVPNGTFLDLWECFNGRSIYDPADITCQTLLIRGAQDPTSTRHDSLGLFDRLGAPDRAYIEIADGTHFINAEHRAPALFAQVSAFLRRINRPSPQQERERAL